MIDTNEMAAMGGKARAAKMTNKEKSASAKRASESRWSKNLPSATHGSADHPLRIGEVEIPCYVLSDGRRMIVQGGVFTGLDMSQGTAGRGEGDRLAKFIAGKAINPHVSKALAEMINNPVKFKTTGGSLAYGYEATVLADLCDAVLEARRIGKLNYQTEHIAERCEILVRAFARVGIIALVDEATGFQYDRPRRDLEEQMKRFLSEELVRYIKGFPAEYFKHLCRLKGVEIRPDMRLPQYFGNLTNDLIYRRIAPGLVKALKERRAERGKKSNKLYWWTSDDIGYPALQRHLGCVVTLMKINTEYEAFYKQLNELASIYDDTPGLFDNPEDWKEPEASQKKK